MSAFRQYSQQKVLDDLGGVVTYNASFKVLSPGSSKTPDFRVILCGWRGCLPPQSRTLASADSATSCLGKPAAARLDRGTRGDSEGGGLFRDRSRALGGRCLLLRGMIADILCTVAGPVAHHVDGVDAHKVPEVVSNWKR